MQKVAEFFKVEPQYFLEGDTIINNNVETSNNSAIGNIPTVNNTLNEDLFKSVMQNQQQISQLMEMQNKLIEKMLKEKQGEAFSTREYQNPDRFLLSRNEKVQPERETLRLAPRKCKPKRFGSVSFRETLNRTCLNI